MNTKNNDTPHFNIADVIIIIAIAAVIAALALRAYNIFGTGEETHEVRVSFKVENVSEGSVSLKESSSLYCSDSNERVGLLEFFEAEESFKYAYNEEGELVKAAVPGKVTVTGTMVLECEKTEKGFYLSGTHLLSQGSTLKLYTSTREMEFTIIAIEEIKADEEKESVFADNANGASS